MQLPGQRVQADGLVIGVGDVGAQQRFEARDVAGQRGLDLVPHHGVEAVGVPGTNEREAHEDDAEIEGVESFQIVLSQPESGSVVGRNRPIRERC